MVLQITKHAYMQKDQHCQPDGKSPENKQQKNIPATPAGQEIIEHIGSGGAFEASEGIREREQETKKPDEPPY